MTEGPRDILLRRIQITLGILAATIGIFVGIHNIRKMNEPAPPPPIQERNVPGRALSSALEEAGAEWIRKVARPKEE